MKSRCIACLAFMLVVFYAIPATSTGTAGEVFSLHVGSYPSTERAVEQVKKLKEKGCDAFSAEAEGRNGRWRVFIGRYGSAAEAAREGEKLESKKTIRFFTVRKIKAMKVSKEPPGTDVKTTVKDSPASELLKTQATSGKPLHPQVTMMPAARETSSKKKALPLDAFLEKNPSGPSGDAVTEGMPQPEHIQLQPFDMRKDSPSAGNSSTGLKDGSPPDAEALFAEATDLYRKGKYSKAVDTFQTYIRQFANGLRSKESLFWIAECHSRMQDPKKADEVFREALKHRLEYRDTPREVLASLGFHFFRQGAHDQVIETFSYYVNLYSDDPFRKEMLYLIARSLTEMQQYEPALKVFSVVMEKYPDTKEAWESTIIMANIGVKSPGLKLPIFMKGAHHYRDPVATYDMVLSENPPGMEMTERILFQKSYCLYRKKLFREAFQASLAQLKRFPNGRCRDAGLEILKAVTVLLVDEDYRKKDDLRVAETYLTAYEGAWVKAIDFGTGYKIADSLRRIGLYREVRRLAEHLLTIEKDERNRGALLVMMADVNVREGRYDEADQVVTELAKQTSSLSRDDRQTMRRLQGDLHLKKGFFQKAAIAYAEVAGEGAADAAALYRSYGVALRFSEAYPSALQQFQAAIRQCEKIKAEDRQVLRDSLAGAGDCYLKTGKYPEAIEAYRRAIESAQSGSQNPWTLYNLGKSYVEMKNLTDANRVFAELKVRTGDEFWNKTIDYTLSDAAWSEKYRRYLSAK